jgi:hypothetical protein
MSIPRFDFDIEGAIRELRLTPAKVANPANRDAQFIESGRYSNLINSPVNIKDEDIELRFEIEERSAIMEIDGGLPREDADRMAFERVIGLLSNNEIESVANLPLSQIKLLVEAKPISNGDII